MTHWQFKQTFAIDWLQQVIYVININASAVLNTNDVREGIVVQR